VTKESRAALRPNRNAARNGSDAHLLPPRLTIRYLPVDSLRLDPLNPRVHSEKQIQQIAKSIRNFGFNVPILIDHEGNVRAGHGRLLGSNLLGMTEVPTICLDHLSPHQVRAFMIADNKLSLNSAWDEVLLGAQLKALSKVELDFDLEATGFEMAEIDLLIEGIASSADGAKDSADAIPEKLGFRVSKSGDLWKLDGHRILCDNALDPESYARLMTDHLASVIFADPHSTCLSTDMPQDWARSSTAISSWPAAK
jgi:ParB-like nuclease domain